MVQERGRHVRFNQQRTQGGIVAGSGDVSPQMGLAGKYTAELAAATTAQLGEEPGRAGGAGEDPRTPGSLLQWPRPWP